MTCAQDDYPKETEKENKLIKYLIGGVGGSKNQNCRSSYETECFKEELETVTGWFNWTACDYVKH